MSAIGFDETRCRRRSRIAAVRDGVDASPLRFLDHGMMDDDEARQLIRRSNTAGSHPLDFDDVYIHYLEAANSRFIGDRFMFLDYSTLKNIAAVASGPGIAFMNSHRTGGLSAPSELPFGRAFAGRYDEFADPTTGARHGRTALGIYMLKGLYPNGRSGPSTDDLHRSIEAGTLSDVSMGLSGGTRVCDVCGEDLTAKHPETRKYLCPHAPGTHRQMGPEHVEAQTARGVKGGKASYTLVEAMPQEVSAVFKGAVPGAGFRKALALSRAGELTYRERAEARESYVELLESDDRTFTVGLRGGGSRASGGVWAGIVSRLGGRTTGSRTRTAAPGADRMEGYAMDFLKAFRLRPSEENPDEVIFEATAERAASRGGGRPTDEEDPEKVVLRAKVEELERLGQKARVDGYEREAERFAAGEIAAGRLLPACKDDLVRVYVALAAIDHDSPVAKGPNRVDTYRATQSRVKPHSLTREEVGTESLLPAGSRVLDDVAEGPETPEQYAARVNAKHLGRFKIGVHGGGR